MKNQGKVIKCRDPFRVNFLRRPGVDLTKVTLLPFKCNQQSNKADENQLKLPAALQHIFNVKRFRVVFSFSAIVTKHNISLSN